MDTRDARDFASLSDCEQMVMEPTHIGGGVLNLVLTDVPDVVGVRVSSPVGASDHSAVFIDVLNQPIPHLVCRREVYFKNSVDWELDRGNVKGLNWNRIIRFPCPVSSINEALMRVNRDRVPKQTIEARTGDNLWFDDRCVLAHRAKQKAYKVRGRSRKQADWEEYRVARRRDQLAHECAVHAANS